MLSFLVLLLLIVLAASLAPGIQEATGVPHPDYPGMFVSPTNIDHNPLTRWLGYLFGLGVICLFGSMLLIGNRKNSRATSMKPWLIVGIILYLTAYTFMVMSHWSYTHSSDVQFILTMPKPTAWMIYVVWFIPLVITIGYIIRFEDAIISEEEELDFYNFLKRAQPDKN